MEKYKITFRAAYLLNIETVNLSYVFLVITHADYVGRRG